MLVVYQASLKAQWAAEVEHFSDRSVQVVLGSGPERAAQYRGPAFSTLVNHEQVRRDLKEVEAAPGT